MECVSQSLFFVKVSHFDFMFKTALFRKLKPVEKIMTGLSC